MKEEIIFEQEMVDKICEKLHHAISNMRRHATKNFKDYCQFYMADDKRLSGNRLYAIKYIPTESGWCLDLERLDKGHTHEK